MATLLELIVVAACLTIGVELGKSLARGIAEFGLMIHEMICLAFEVFVKCVKFVFKPITAMRERIHAQVEIETD